ncbi:hypothetical protein RJ226_004004 [Enterobacter hormaechei]|nr:hypothetical protein [Enterobacter hormaechei]ELD3190793.1 hypothetical protein [Enterobacter hormaechei]
MASAALVRIAGHTDDMIRDRTALLALRFAGWNYDSRTDMSPACQVLAERVQHLARQISPAEWQWATEYEQNNRTLAASAL